MGKASLPSTDVFINAPFDAKYERQFLALVAGIVGLGLNPRSVLELPASHDRLTRLLELIRQCPYSIHDLSRVEVSRDKTFRVPRFNMPFELGLAVGVALDQGGHEWQLLEAVSRTRSSVRATKSDSPRTGARRASASVAQETDYGRRWRL